MMELRAIRRRRFAPRVAAIGMVVAGAGRAFAEGGPPMITDDPGTPGDGVWEINIAWIVEHSDDGTAHELPLLDINYGVGDRLQLKFEVPWVRLHESGAGTQSGLGKSMIGVKWRFHDAGDGGWRASTYPQVEFENPGSRSGERGLAQPGTSVKLPFQFEREFALFGLDFELAHTWHSRAADEWSGGIAIGRELCPRLELAGELAGSASKGLGRTALTANVGARWSVSGHHTLLVSVGRSLYDHLEDADISIGYLGWQIVY